MPTAEQLRHLVLAVVLVLVTGLALHDSYPWSGPVLLSVTATHGVHATDPLLLSVLALGLALLARSAGFALQLPGLRLTVLRRPVLRLPALRVASAGQPQAA